MPALQLQSSVYRVKIHKMENAAPKIEITMDLSKYPIVEFRPYMLEVAHEYLLASKSVKTTKPSLVLAALSLEIILKSFNSEATENEGSIDERYRFHPRDTAGNEIKKKPQHNLNELFQLVPKEFHNLILRNQSDLRSISIHRNAFTDARYFYENTKYTNGADPYTGCFKDLQKIAEYALCMITLLYQYQGCQDPFISSGSPISEFKISESKRWTAI